MTNFILKLGDLFSSTKLKDSYRILLNQDSCNLNSIPLGPCGKFASLGDVQDDINFSHNQDKSFLVMDGYVTESNYSLNISSPKEITDALISFFDNNPSKREIGDLFSGLSGSFSVSYVNYQNGNSILVSDRICSRPLYYSSTNKVLTLANNPNIIVSLDNNFHYDLGALGSFLFYGGPVEPVKSIYRGTFGVPPGSVLIFVNNSIHDSYQWYYFQHTPNNFIKKNEWVELITDKIKISTSKILKTAKNPLLFLSGGIDSRLAASALKSLGASPTLATLCDGNNLELSVSKKVAMALSCPHHVIVRDPHWYLKNLPNAVFSSGGSFEWTHAHFSQAYRETRKMYGNDVAILGDFFEVFSKLCCEVGDSRTKVWSPEEFVRNFDMLPLSNYRPINKERTLRLINPEVRGLLLDELYGNIWNRYSKIQSVSDDPKIVADFFFRWHTAPTISTFLMFLDLRSAGPERSIMFEKDLHGLLEVLPSSLRNQANLGALLIKNLWPPASRVVNSNTLLPITWPTVMHSFSKRMKPYLGKTRRFIFSNSYKTTGSWPKKSMLYFSDQKWRTTFETILMDGTLFDGTVFNIDEVRNCWRSFLKGDMRLAPDIEKLVQIGVGTQIVRGNTKEIESLFT